ncbi:MAG: hypothetical protein U5K69_12110 [Balneolaceae bacterium]|nr:hypothetical protein [Balneolaceae bacterium]
MELKQSVFIAASLDGFIARPDGDLDWLPVDDARQNDEDYGYDAFISSVDAIVMERNTFENVLSFKEWPYNIYMASNVKWQ